MIAGLTAAFLLLSCQTAGVPKWRDNLDAAYPRDKYIAQIGSGKTREAAKANAIAEISRYFAQEVETTISSRESLVETVDSASTARRLDNETFLRSQMELFALRYSDPWQNRKENQWETVAYIDRGEAENIFQPQLRQSVRGFQALFDKAGNEKDAMKRMVLYHKAEAAALSENLPAKLSFANMLNPKKAAGFDEIHSLLALLPLKIDEAKEGAVIFIDCPGDFNGRIKAAFDSCFAAQGFKTSDGDSHYALEAAVTFTPAMRGKYFNARYTVDAVLKNTQTGARLLSYNIGDRESHPNGQAEADNRAVIGAEKKILTEFPQVLHDYIYSN
jgi:hypothetical protein